MEGGFVTKGLQVLSNNEADAGDAASASWVNVPGGHI
jgi:hypothetical protein